MKPFEMKNELLDLIKEKETIPEILQRIEIEKGEITIQDLKDIGIFVGIDLAREEEPT